MYMQRFTKLFVAATMVVATTAAVLVGCKKEKDEPKDNAQQSEAAVLVNRINNFLELRDAVNSGAKADGSMTVEEMRQILDLTTNYEHSEHMTYCQNTVLDTMYFAMPRIGVNGCVSEADVVKVYDAFETELEKKILAVNDAMDIPSYFSIVMPDIEAKDADIQVVFLRGEADDYTDNDEHTSDGPFREGDDWIWGLNLGPCDPTGYTGRMVDAADKLTQQFVFTPDQQHQGRSCILQNVEHAVYTPSGFNLPLGWIYYVDPNMEDCAPTWLFLYEGQIPDSLSEPCISWDEMNCYWRSIRRNIVLPNAPLHYGPITHSPYHECCIIDRLDCRCLRRMHCADVVYCYVIWSEPILPPVD